MKRRVSSRVAVVGGGLLGTTTALLLDNAGVAVDLIDTHTGIWQGATAAGEGKIHLGFVYALAERSTALSMAEGALTFDSVVEEALGQSLDWRGLTSAGFSYVRHPDSLVSPGDLAEHYEFVHAVMREVADGGIGRSYLGRPPEGMQRPAPTRANGLWRFATDERAVDMARLRVLFQRSLSTSRVTSRMSTTVRDAHVEDARWWLSVADSGQPATLGPYDAIVNATWDQREHLDCLAFPSRHPESLNFRLRAFVDGLSRSPLPSVTVVQGPFGDVVGFASGRFYASWYTNGLLGFATGQLPPEDWGARADEACRDSRLAEEMLAAVCTIAGMSPVVGVMRVKARVVVAHGETDIDQTGSQLHRREAPTIAADTRWVTPRNYKLTTAPLAARETGLLVQRLLA